MTFFPSDYTLSELQARFADRTRPSRSTLERLRADPRAGVRRLAEVLDRRGKAALAERRRMRRLLAREESLREGGCEHVAGVDEAGVGPLAGPVVAAAVIFEAGTAFPGVDDSKRLDREARETLAVEIRARARAVGVGIAEVDEIDRLNIYHAGLLAMRRAVEALAVPPQHLLIDARSLPELEVEQSPIIGGDHLCFSIAAASILAKTHRDRLMQDLDQLYPGYELARHKGYPTPDHKAALRRLGPSPIHRRSFAFVRELLPLEERRRYEKAVSERSASGKHPGGEDDQLPLFPA